MPASGSAVTLRTVLPQPSREDSPDGGDLADQLGHLIERHVVDLDVLARRDVRLVQRRVALGDVGEHVHLLRRDPAERQLHAHHLHVRLALAVDALLQAEADELVLRRVTREELAGLAVEVVELVLEDRDDVAGDVLDDLGVVQRSGAAVGRGSVEDGSMERNIQIPVGIWDLRGKPRNDVGPPIGGPAPQSLRRTLRRLRLAAMPTISPPWSDGHRPPGVRLAGSVPTTLFVRWLNRRTRHTWSIRSLNMFDGNSFTSALWPNVFVVLPESTNPAPRSR